MAPKTRNSSSHAGAAAAVGVSPSKRKHTDDSDDNATQPPRKSSKSEHDSNVVQSSAATTSPTAPVVSPTASGGSKITILPSSDLQILRDDLIIAEQNNQVLRDHNLQLLEDNDKLVDQLAKEQHAVALLHETSKEWAKLEAEMKMKQGIMIVNVNDLARQVKQNGIGNAPLVNRVTQLEVTSDALNATIQSLRSEIEVLKEYIEAKKSLYPPL